MSMIERDVRIFEALIKGRTFAEAAKAEGVTRERAKQLVHKMQRKMLNPTRLGTETAPICIYGDIEGFRANADFWLAQMSKWKSEHGYNLP